MLFLLNIFILFHKRSIKLSQHIQSGFLLSRHVQDKGNTLQITLWVKTHTGAQKLVIDNELAVFFIEETNVNYAVDLLKQHDIKLIKQQNLALQTFTQTPVHGFYFANLAQFYRARDCLKAKQIKCYEDDIRPDDRYLMERFITADIDFICTPQVKCKKSKDMLSIHLTMLSLDIECSMAGELYSIGLYANNTNRDNHLETASNKNIARELTCVLMIGKPEPDAAPYIIWVENENNGTTSNDYGEFIINETDSTKNIVFSAIGYKRETVQISQIKNIIYLKPETTVLEEVVLTKKKESKKIVIDNYKEQRMAKKKDDISKRSDINVSCWK